MISLISSNIDTAPATWLNQDRQKKLHLVFDTSLEILKFSKLLDQALYMWVKQQVAREFDEIQDFEPQLFNIDPNISDKTDLINIKCDCWAEALWSNQLESFYLERKPELDQVSFKMLRVDNKFLAYELFHRLEAKEASFHELSREFGKEPERSRGGEFGLQSIKSLPKGLIKTLASLETYEILNPISYGDGYAIFQLNEWCPSEFNKESKRYLLRLALHDWITSINEKIFNELNLNETSVAHSENY